ncbi:YjjG family noncanonical pyrimidine nucleotidase [Rhabdobacter roseus]|uniref:Putative hydrolase of the HAD superfamily n=1 Tax=Rhabdobacter roseus TaxID=1655419 RepID=A0A840TPT9_9BACT|nr:YjjG family noncanonical pyrimidine nucleotidase [Rhabdobacter roseus]MBB5284915.1 putative hydrolase of the HAD superfamily [Rhabdobacter roseus]
MKYKHLFFDLDHTLWDFERNSAESLTELFERFTLGQCGIPSCEEFISTFSRINIELWATFNRGDYTHAYIRERRFPLVFEALQVPTPTNCSDLAQAYLQILPTKQYLLEGALDVLHYTRERGYRLHVLTNGFEAIQNRKMKSADIVHFFEHVVTNEHAQAQKPDPRIFAYALGLVKARPEDCIMIGDNWEADILGAMRFGLDTVYYNPLCQRFDDTPTHDIRHLHELKAIF